MLKLMVVVLLVLVLVKHLIIVLLLLLLLLWQGDMQRVDPCSGWVLHRVRVLHCLLLRVLLRLQWGMPEHVVACTNKGAMGRRCKRLLLSGQLLALLVPREHTLLALLMGIIRSRAFGPEWQSLRGRLPLLVRAGRL